MLRTAILLVTGKERCRPGGLSLWDAVLLLTGRRTTAEAQVSRATQGIMGEKMIQGNCTDY